MSGLIKKSGFEKTLKILGKIKFKIIPNNVIIKVNLIKILS
jgi:hypothetical protein